MTTAEHLAVELASLRLQIEDLKKDNDKLRLRLFNRECVLEELRKILNVVKVPVEGAVE